MWPRFLGFFLNVSYINQRIYDLLIVRFIPYKILLFVTFPLIFNCCDTNNSSTTKELELKKKELELKEKEIFLLQRQLDKINEEQRKKAAQKSELFNSGIKELRFLYHSNGGIIGYFDDGTVANCVRCDFIRSNILTLFNEKPIGSYEILSDGSLLIKGVHGNNNSERLFPNYEDDAGWALIDYKWNEKVPQY
jgi:hypothetical protein